MNNTSKPRKRSRVDGVYIAPWEQAFKKILTPFEEFIHRQTTSGLLLMIMAVVALILKALFAMVRDRRLFISYAHQRFAVGCILALLVLIPAGSWATTRPRAAEARR